MLDTPWTVPGYTHVRELGHGAGGRIMLATDDQTGREVAIKYLSAQLYGDPGFYNDFPDDAWQLTGMDSGQAVQLYDYVETPEGAATVMEYIDGISLRDILVGHGPIAPEPALWVLKSALLGLCPAHDIGVVHRSLKPANVLVTRDGDAKITDFGIVARAGSAGVASGMAGYLAPEQWQGETAGPESDVYAATAVFVQCLTGQPPYPVSSAVRLRRQHESAPIPLSGIPEPLSELVTRGLAKDLGDRPPRASVLLVELEAAALASYGTSWSSRGRRQLATRAAIARLVPPSRSAVAAASTIPDARRRRRALAAIAGAATLAVIGGAIVTITQNASNATSGPAAGAEFLPAPEQGAPPAGPEAAGPPTVGSPQQLPAGVTLALPPGSVGRMAHGQPTQAAPAAQPPLLSADRPARPRPVARPRNLGEPPQRSHRLALRSATVADGSDAPVRRFRAAETGDGSQERGNSRVAERSGNQHSGSQDGGSRDGGSRDGGQNGANGHNRASR